MYFDSFPNDQIDNFEEITLKISQFPKASRTHRRITLTTHSRDPDCVDEDRKVKLYHLILLPNEKLLKIYLLIFNCILNEAEFGLKYLSMFYVHKVKISNVNSFVQDNHNIRCYQTTFVSRERIQVQEVPNKSFLFNDVHNLHVLL